MRPFEGYRRSRLKWRPNERQSLVLDLLVEGKTNPEIAEALGITLDGAKWHVSELLAATGCEDRQALATWWRRERERGRAGLLSWLPPLAPGRVAIVAFAGGVLVAMVVLVPSRTGDEGSGDALPSEAAADFALPAATTTFQPSYVKGPPPPCDMPLPPEFRSVTREELLAEGLVESGPSYDANGDCPVLVSNREDRAVIWFPDGGIIANGATLAERDLDLTLIRGEASSVNDSVPVQITIGSHVRRVGPEGVFAIMKAKDEKSGRPHRIAFDSQGNMYFAPDALPEDGAYDYHTGQRIQTEGMTRFSDLDLTARGSFALTMCDVETSSCAVSYRGYGLGAPADGRLRCLEPDGLEYEDGTGRPLGEYELDSGEYLLRFQEFYTNSPNLRTTFGCEPRDIAAGARISDHDHFWITVLSADGEPLSVVVAGDGRLYAGTVQLRYACPCGRGN